MRLRWIGLLVALASGCAKPQAHADGGAATSVDGESAKVAISPTATEERPSPEAGLVVPDAGESASVVTRARAMCTALVASDDTAAKAFVRLPLSRRVRVGGDACASGDVPCKYRTKTIKKTSELTCSGWIGLDPVEPPIENLERSVVTRGTKSVVESGIGQFPLYLLFERTADGFVLVDISEEKSQLK